MHVYIETNKLLIQEYIIEIEIIPGILLPAPDLSCWVGDISSLGSFISKSKTIYMYIYIHTYI